MSYQNPLILVAMLRLHKANGTEFEEERPRILLSACLFSNVGVVGVTAYDRPVRDSEFEKGRENWCLMAVHPAHDKEIQKRL